MDGAVYTVDAERSWAQAVAILDGRIVYVGDDNGARRFISGETEVIDLDGRMLMPGFHDSHMHPMAAGTRFFRCDLADLAWPDAVLEKITSCAAGPDEGEWLRGVDLADELFDNGVLDRALLDGIVSDRPAVITNRSGFAIWTNSLGLEISGIDTETPDPRKGVVARRSGSREPSGVLLGPVGRKLYAQLPDSSVNRYRKALKRASELANRHGITFANEAKVSGAMVDAFIAAENAGEMTLRVQGSLYWDPDGGFEQIRSVTSARAAGMRNRFRANAVKFFLDGDFPQRTAAVLEPYIGSMDDIGAPNFDIASLQRIARELDNQGMQLHFHAVGDAAVRQALDAVEHAIASNDPWDRRHQVAHLMLIDPSDLPRFAELGVTADIQALWAYWDEQKQQVSTSLGDERAARLLTFRSLFDSGARVVAGSDWISDSMNPLYSIQVALTRRPPDGSAPAWIPEQRVTLQQMIEAYTINGAWLANLEHETGSIEVGKSADLIALDRNLFDVDPMKLVEVQVLLTLLEGDIVYRSAAL